jgi:hypothetical protein
MLVVFRCSQKQITGTAQKSANVVRFVVVIDNPSGGLGIILKQNLLLTNPAAAALFLKEFQKRIVIKSVRPQLHVSYKSRPRFFKTFVPISAVWSRASLTRWLIISNATAPLMEFSRWLDLLASVASFF